ncbi:MAG: glycerate kinase [Actinomycetes bacterium]
MRIVVAPDKFGGTLSAVEASAAIATGWRRGAADAVIDEVPLSDGGPGFVDVLHNSLGGDLLPVTVRDPLARPVPGAVLLVNDTAYVESAQACGLHLLAAKERNPTNTSTYGVGQLVLAALDAGATRIVIGLGGSATNDGGRGMLGALGLRETQHAEALQVDRSGLDARLAQAELVAATDVDNPLLGPSGASVVFGPQKGARPETVALLEARMRMWARAVDPAAAERPGAGAAGGLGFAIFLLGGRRESGVHIVGATVGLAAAVTQADLVVTGEGRFDDQSLRGKVVSGVAEAAQAAGVRCVVLAGQVRLDADRAAAAGVDRAYAVTDEVGSVEEAMRRPAAGLERLAERVARDYATM